MGAVRHKYDSPSPNEDHELDLEAADIKDLSEVIAEGSETAEALNFFLSL